MSQMKGQDNTPEKQLNELETVNHPEEEFIIMTLKMIQDLRIRMEKIQEIFTKDLEELKKNKQRRTIDPKESIAEKLKQNA